MIIGVKCLLCNSESLPGSLKEISMYDHLPFRKVSSRQTKSDVTRVNQLYCLTEQGRGGIRTEGRQVGRYNKENKNISRYNFCKRRDLRPNILHIRIVYVSNLFW